MFKLAFLFFMFIYITCMYKPYLNISMDNLPF